MRELLLLRHGEAKPAHYASDFLRALNPEGRRATKQVAAWTIEQSCQPDIIIASPAERTKETAELFCEALGASPVMIWESAIYEATVRTLLTVLANAPRAERVMVIGHNPGIEGLIRHLSESIPAGDNRNLVPTATLARLLCTTENWMALRPGCARLLALIPPHVLRDQGHVD